MIQRKNQITLGSSEISFSVSYSAIDVWSWLHHFAWLMHRDNPLDFDVALNTPRTKQDIIHFLTHCPDHGLGWMPEKRALPIAEWAFDMALKRKYLLPTFEKDGRQYYTLASMLAKKNGRPRTEGWIWQMQNFPKRSNGIQPITEERKSPKASLRLGFAGISALIHVMHDLSCMRWKTSG